MNEDGAVSFRTLFWLFLITVIVYLGIKFVPPYFTYYMFKGEVDGEAQTAHVYSDQEIIKHILEKARDSELPIGEGDITVKRWEDALEVSIRYSIDVNLLNWQTKTLFFSIRSIKPIKAKQY